MTDKIEERAREWANENAPTTPEHAFKAGYLAGAAEQRERGLREARAYVHALMVDPDVRYVSFATMLEGLDLLIARASASERPEGTIPQSAIRGDQS